MMNLSLKLVSEDFEDYKIITQVDQSRWHLSKDLTIPENIALTKQPPYSPELNLVEQIGTEIREKFLDNKLFESLDDLVNQLCYGLKEISTNGDKRRLMTSFPHIKTVIQNTN